MEKRPEPSPLEVGKLKTAALNGYYGEYSHPEMAGNLRDMARGQLSRWEEEIKDYEEYRLIKNRLYPREVIAERDLFEDSRFYDAEGRADYLANYVGKGKYVLIDCWFADCGPCRKILPEVKELTEKLSDELIVVGFNYLDKKERWLTGTEELGIKGINLWSPDSFHGLGRKYGFMANPVFAIISPEGEVLDIFYGSQGYLTQTVRSFMDPDIPRPIFHERLRCIKLVPGIDPNEVFKDVGVNN
ncbi:MAG: TlpA family protein disulfide reductase [Alistipes sp.]|nr:TlpA family protein disulfide reductase [Alistipes sp.]